MARITTPFGYRLQSDLNNEFTKMDSEWFFRWHGLNSGRDVDVDNFNGRRIRLGGILFDGCEPVYWSAINRYLSNKINEAFTLAEKEIVNLAHPKVVAIADDAANVIGEYCSRIRRHAIETERLLKGRGNPDPNYHSHFGERLDLGDEVQRRKRALAEFFVQPDAPTAKVRSFERFIELNKGKLQLLGGLAALTTIVGMCLRFFGVF